MDERHYQQCRELGIVDQIADQGTYDSNESRRIAVAIAMRLIGWPAFFVVSIVAVAGLVAVPSPGTLIAGMICGTMTVTIITISVGYSIGWVAHRLFWGTSIPVKRMAVVMALIVDLAAFGWILLIF